MDYPSAQSLTEPAHSGGRFTALAYCSCHPTIITRSVWSVCQLISEVAKRPSCATELLELYLSSNNTNLGRFT